MRIENIAITWFRGSADRIDLNTRSKSVVVYGENGSGKSSFVDAMEYALKSGRIGHLAHEYSGKHQEKSVINTHTPIDQITSCRLLFRKTLQSRVKSIEVASQALLEQMALI
jgi:AAA15 family ATPase/GTPase